jgi:hypothetical protein
MGARSLVSARWCGPKRPNPIFVQSLLEILVPLLNMPVLPKVIVGPPAVAR